MTRLDRIREIVTGSGTDSPWRAQTLGPSAGAAAGLAPDRAVEQLGGRREPGPEGPAFVVRRTYGSRERYGRWPLGDYPVLSAPALDVVGGHAGSREVSTCPAGIICLDLETTGLSGGAGTLGFLIGLGWRERDGFHTCQFFLDNLADERRMLVAVAEMLSWAHTVVTFNGRSFDGPVLETRYAFHRLRSPLERLRHIDLLHPSRHLWTTGDARLVTLEQVVLGLRREGDVAGAEIPGRYVTFLRCGDAEMIESVFEHNRLDIVSLGLLAGLACRLVSHGATAATNASQALGLGRIYEKVGQEAAAVSCYRCAAREDGRDDTHVGDGSGSHAAILDVPARALGRLARILRRQRRYPEAADAWTCLLSQPHIPERLRQEATVALAVHHEHRLRDLASAHRFALHALENERHPTRRDAVVSRVTRLRRKIDASAQRRLLGERV